MASWWGWLWEGTGKKVIWVQTRFPSFNLKFKINRNMNYYKPDVGKLSLNKSVVKGAGLKYEKGVQEFCSYGRLFVIFYYDFAVPLG